MEKIRINQMDLDRLLSNDAWKAFISDMQDRYDDAISFCSGTLVKDQETLVQLSKEQGAIEIIEMINGWVALTQLEIEERNKKEEEKDVRTE